MLGVLARNPRFRRIWYAQVVSQAGDWLNRIAVLSLIVSLGGSTAGGLGLLIAAELASRLLSPALMGPLAGPVADRLPRRRLMIAADLTRAAIVLALLLIRDPEQLPLLYGLLILQMGVGIFFESARSASVPNVVSADDLHAAYSLSAVTWSVMLSFGALLGGALVTAVGPKGVFVLDALTYVVSALMLSGLELPPAPRQPERLYLRDVLLLRDLRRGLTHVRSLNLTVELFAKSFWGGAGGYLVLLTLLASERFGDGFSDDPMRSAGTASVVGFFYFARGVGTGIGPIIARRLNGDSDTALRAQVAAGFAVGAGGYALLGFVSSLPVAILCVVFAHMGGSTIWVASTVLWQKRVEDAYRGRVYALEFLCMMVAFTLGGFFAGGLFDLSGSLNLTIWATSALVLGLGMVWTVLAYRTRNERAAPRAVS